MTADPPGAPPVRLVLGGDAMLGRHVGACIGRVGPDYPLGAIAPLMRQADLAIVNLECAITRCTQHWTGEPKAFYFGAPPGAAQSLADAGVRLASLANNHILDFGVGGLRDTIALLAQHGIAHAGAGGDLAEALRPAIMECKGLRFGMAAFCDHQRDFAAAARRAGMAWLDLQDEAKALASFERALAPLHAAGVDWPILSLHWGPNMLWRPSARFRRLAQAAVDQGWKIVYGHSAHVFHGIELRHGAPILYAAGDLVDDYAVDPAFRNDHQLLFELELTSRRVERIRLHPLFIARGRTGPATAEQTGWIAGQMEGLCAELGTRLDTGATPWEITPA